MPRGEQGAISIPSSPQTAPSPSSGFTSTIPLCLDRLRHLIHTTHPHSLARPPPPSPTSTSGRPAASPPQHPASHARLGHLATPSQRDLSCPFVQDKSAAGSFPSDTPLPRLPSYTDYIALVRWPESRRLLNTSLDRSCLFDRLSPTAVPCPRQLTSYTVISRTIEETPVEIPFWTPPPNILTIRTFLPGSKSRFSL